MPWRTTWFSLMILALGALVMALVSFDSDVHAEPSATGQLRAGPDAWIWFEGACDASGAVGIDSRRFLLADDEDNVLRVYDAEQGGKPLFETDFSGALGLMGKKRGKEADIEGGTRIGDTAYFLASHGRKSDGRHDPNRLLFFAVSVPTGNATPVLVGRPYRTLIEDMLKHPALTGLGLGEAAQLAPKAPGGLNLEGLGSTTDGSLLLGFRNPVPNGRALIVRLSNPREVLDGKPPKLSAAISLDLEGLGIRALSYFRGEHLIAAGATGDGGHGKLFRWDGEKRVARIELRVPGFSALNPEALFTPEERREILVLSDDGTQLIDGEPCKRVKDASAKRFRGMWVRLD